MDKAIEKAKELGNIIKDSDELSKLNEHEEKLKNDEKAQNLINDYNALQGELTRAVQAKKEELVEGIKQKVISKQQELYDYETTKNYLEAKSKFDNFIKTINDVIMYSITGEEGCSSESCGTCGGCG